MGYSRVLPRYRSGHCSARLLRHGRGAARVVPLCAGAYVSGAAGSNACPAGSVRIEAEAACRTAVAAAGKTPSTYWFVGTDSRYPRGCYYFTSSNDAHFNTHAVGAGQSDSQLLCAVATAGAPLKRRRRTDAHSACTGDTARVPTPRVCCAAFAGGVRYARPA
jgi:hypothetical protein